MAKLGCPCGNTLSNSCDGYETEYDFVPFDVFDEYFDSSSMFSLDFESDRCVNIWKCDMCDRFMVFDDDLHVSRWMKRISTDVLPAGLTERSSTEGYIYNNLLFNDVDWHFSQEWEETGRSYEYNWDYLTPRRITEEIFSGKNGRFRNWWYCRDYGDYIVFYGEKEMKYPLKAWEKYDQKLTEV